MGSAEAAGGSIAYQRFSDSPTVKHYTDWRAFEPYLSRVGRCQGDGFSYDASGDVAEGDLSAGSLLPPDESKIVGAHYAALGSYRSLAVRGSSTVRVSPTDGGCGPVSSRHAVIAVSPGARLDLEVVVGSDESLDLSFLELFVGQGSTVNVLFQVRGGGAPSAAGVRAALGAGSRLNYLLLGTGSAMHHQDDRAVLGKSSALRASAFLLSSGGARADRFLGIEHVGESSSSNATSLGVALDGGYVVVRGISKLSETARRGSASFTAGVVVVGRGSRGYAVPMLEVHVGDVARAEHHAFEAKPDEDQLFYLRSRGLSEPEARGLVISGMASLQLEALEGALSDKASRALEEIMRRAGLEPYIGSSLPPQAPWNSGDLKR